MYPVPHVGQTSTQRGKAFQIAKGVPAPHGNQRMYVNKGSDPPPPIPSYTLAHSLPHSRKRRERRSVCGAM